jgi:hypothetical protein
VARLRSPELWEQGPLCVHFAYYMFGLSWGTQLRLLLLMGTQDERPNVLWKHVNTQSPSWMPTSVTLPAELILPSRVRSRADPGPRGILGSPRMGLWQGRGMGTRLSEFNKETRSQRQRDRRETWPSGSWSWGSLCLHPTADI